MAKKQKIYSVDLDPGKVRGANISRYSDGYSYASMSFKMSDKEHMSVNYEWQGGDIPEFALNVMEIMQGLGKKDQASLEVADTVAVMERAAKMFMDSAAKMKKEKDPDMEEMDEEDPKKKKSKKKTDKKC